MTISFTPEYHRVTGYNGKGWELKPLVNPRDGAVRQEEERILKEGGFVYLPSPERFTQIYGASSRPDVPDALGVLVFLVCMGLILSNPLGPVHAVLVFAGYAFLRDIYEVITGSTRNGETGLIWLPGALFLVTLNLLYGFVPF